MTVVDGFPAIAPDELSDEQRKLLRLRGALYPYPTGILSDTTSLMDAASLRNLANRNPMLREVIHTISAQVAACASHQGARSLGSKVVCKRTGSH